MMVSAVTRSVGEGPDWEVHASPIHDIYPEAKWQFGDWVLEDAYEPTLYATEDTDRTITGFEIYIGAHQGRRNHCIWDDSRRRWRCP